MIRVRDEKAQVSVAKVYRANQQHIFRFWEDLPRAEELALLEQVEDIDFQLLERLVEEHVLDPRKPPTRTLTAPEVVDAGADPERDRAAREAGEDLLRAGKVGAFMVAGGQGSRLGYDGPKGAYDIAPVSGKSLYQLLAEQIVATTRRFKAAVPWYIMVSRSTHEATEEFFQEHGYFGLPKADVHFLRQEEMPVVDARGRLVLAEKGRLATAPTGHGGALDLLTGPVLEDIRERGVEWISYFHVDNPLLRVLDPLFLGRANLDEADLGIKVVEKVDAEEPVGIVSYADGRLGVVEYTEISEEARTARDESSRLEHRAANIGAHLFHRAFLDRLAEGVELPYHAAWKKVPHVNRKGERVVPDEPNAVKFETFIFDSFREAEEATILSVPREDEFHPLKQADGERYDPESVRQELVDRAARWLESCGVAVPRDDEGHPEVRIEISPLTALGPRELGEKPPDDLEFEEDVEL